MFRDFFKDDLAIFKLETEETVKAKNLTRPRRLNITAAIDAIGEGVTPAP